MSQALTSADVLSLSAGTHSGNLSATRRRNFSSRLRTAPKSKLCVRAMKSSHTGDVQDRATTNLRSSTINKASQGLHRNLSDSTAPLSITPAGQLRHKRAKSGVAHFRTLQQDLQHIPPQ